VAKLASPLTTSGGFMPLAASGSLLADADRLLAHKSLTTTQGGKPAKVAKKFVNN